MGWRDGIRLILAGLAVFAALLTTMVVVGATGLDKRVPPFVIALLCVVAGIGAIIGALALFNARGDEIPRDGELITQDSYDALKARHASVRRR